MRTPSSYQGRLANNLGGGKSAGESFLILRLAAKQAAVGRSGDLLDLDC
jgi:hypothetical protein